jgi:hypothetical protein
MNKIDTIVTAFANLHKAIAGDIQGETSFADAMNKAIDELPNGHSFEVTISRDWFGDPKSVTIKYSKASPPTTP